MPQRIEAIYEHGIFRPLHPVDLPEGTRVRIEAEISPAETDEQIRQRLLADGASLEEAEKIKAPLLKYGLFLQNILDFVIIAFVIFLLIRQVNKLLVKPAPAPPPEPSKEEKLLAEIRDILKARN